MAESGYVSVEPPMVSAYTIPADAPEADGTFAWDTTTIVVAEVSAGDATGTGWTYAPAATVDLVREQLSPVLAGRDALDIPAAHDALTKAVRDTGREGLAARAISALDIALWDLKARLFEVPLVRLIGAARDDVPVYGSGGFTTYHDTHLAAQLNGWVHGQQIPRVKIKVGESWGRAAARDVSRVRRARDVIGRQAELYVDAGGAYTRKQAVRIGRVLAEHGVGWFEEPVAADDLRGLALVRDALVCDIAAGAYGHGLAYFARLIPSVDCLQADATRCGGLTAWLRAAALAQAHGLEVSARGAPHAHAAVAACVPNLRHVEWFHDHVRIESILFDGALDPTGGTVRPGAGTGHGLLLRTPDVEEYRVA
ncbi:enolase C-terminal domain-like protein [Streptomyces flavofungini]|uniref:Mandelate racemase n=1 Tax=Streptomyces flavofungini TaxID=68200 RepID=A0ABS0X5C8_9ACTN|nr:enolase C-terminal domain-like protein [Streptomyces flavofungini]MBJ3808296.1 mandelate racemase [Streptomyces flavofungini]GHC57692.1 mandelate racemase [Streptomyces flavofungini]